MRTNNTPPKPSENSIPTKRIGWIDRAKAIAMICVVYGHINLYDYYGWGLNIENCKIYSLTAIFQLPLFMFLSGLVASTKRRTIIDSLRLACSKFRQLLMPLITIGGLYALWAFGRYPWEIFRSGAFLGYWYLWCLFVFYVIHYCYEQCATRIEKFEFKIVFDFVWLICFSIMLNIGMKHMSNPDILSYSFIANLFPYFFLGVMVKKYQLQDKIFSNDFPLALGILFSCTFIIAHSQNIRYPLAYQSFCIGMILVVIGIFYRLESHYNSVLNYLNFVGRNTLDVFIFHYFLISSFQNLWIGEWLIAGHYSPFTELLFAGIPALIFCTISIYIGKLIRQSTLLSMIIFNK